jgi:release factor glutamine methyltransferase
MPPEARDHEPRTALDGGQDGLQVFGRIAAGAADWLAPGGIVLVETSTDQIPEAVRLLARAGLRSRAETDDELGATVVLGAREAKMTI